MKRILSQIFAIDSRSLGLARLFLGYLLLSDAFTKLIYAKEFFTDDGIFPRAAYVQDYLRGWYFSFHLASGELWFQVFLIVLGMVASFLFMVGYRWRLAGIVSFILLCSLQNRNMTILTAADDVVRLFLFWFLFLPSPGSFALGGPQQVPAKISGLASAALMLQLLIIYFFTAIWKLDPVYTREYSAVYYSLNLDYFVKPLGVFLRSQIWLTKLLTILTMLLEILGPIAALLPWWPLRIAICLTFISFHFGLFLTLSLGLFSGVMMTYWLLFIPSQAWDFQPLAFLQRLLQKSTGWLQVSHIQPHVLSVHYRARELVSLIALFLVVGLNASGVTAENEFKVGESVEHVAQAANIDQTWKMFAPYPTKSDGWFSLIGTDLDGHVTDLLTNKQPTEDKPPSIADLYPSKEWQTYMMQIWQDEDDILVENFARYICRQHQNLKNIEIVFFEERTPPIGEDFKPIKKHQLWIQACQKNN